MASDLKGLVKECLGPLPRVCQEQVILDLERARMTAEDYRQGNARCEHNPNFLTWRKLEQCRKLREEDADQTISNIADVVRWHVNGQTNASGRLLTDEDCFAQIRAEVQAHGLLNSSDDEMSDEEEEEDDEEEDEDTRPLITPRWRQENSEEWDRLWNLNRTECPMCHETEVIWDGPMNSDVASRCTHWACVSCWARIAQRDKRCPVCRDDLSVWLARHDTDS